jgi:hypothetical protein
MTSIKLLCTENVMLTEEVLKESLENQNEGTFAASVAHTMLQAI